MNSLSRIFCLILLTVLTAHADDDAAFLENIERELNQSLENKIQLSIEKEELSARIKEVEDKLRQRRLLLAKRLRTQHALQDFKWGEWLLDTNLSEVDRNLRILKNLNSYDVGLFREYNTALKLLQADKKNLQETEKLIQNNMELLQTQQSNFHHLEKIRIESLQRSKTQSLLLLKGQLTRPLESPVKQEFGSLRDRHNRFYLLTRGEIYSARTGALVKAVGPGKVIFRDELPRWRETLVVQHDDNYYSVYAGISKSKKNVGDQVAGHETIAQTAAPEFYFELRHYDHPINPKTWYKE